MPDWLIPAFAVSASLAFYIAWAARNTRHMIKKTTSRRENPTREQFLAMLKGDASEQTAIFLWDRIVLLVKPRLTPHPDDDLSKDLPIDPDEPAMDWLPEYAKLHGRNHRDWPQWPQDRQATVRNFARWLELGLMTSTE